MRRFPVVFVIVAVAFIFGLTAVAAEQKKTCRRCNMQLSDQDKKFSVIMPRVPGMEGSSFDDIGCAIKFRNGECATRSSNFDSNAVAFDYGTGEQVLLEKAFFVLGAGITTPMGYDLVAFKEKTAAEKLVAEKGKGQVVKYYELVEMPLKD